MSITGNLQSRTLIEGDDRKEQAYVWFWSGVGILLIARPIISFHVRTGLTPFRWRCHSTTDHFRFVLWKGTNVLLMSTLLHAWSSPAVEKSRCWDLKTSHMSGIYMVYFSHYWRWHSYFERMVFNSSTEIDNSTTTILLSLQSKGSVYTVQRQH